MPKTQSKEPNIPASSSKGLGDIVRLLIFFAAIGVGIWYYYFNKPVALVARETQGRTMGTDYLLKVADFLDKGDPQAWPALKKKVQARLDKIDAAMSTFKPDSEISRFNASASTDWFEVSPDTAAVVKLALEISELTDGAFDITAAPVVNLWGFGPEKANLTLKDLEQQSLALKSKIGYDKLEVQENPPAIKKSIPELTLDLSAVAKGFAVDCLAELLDEQKFAHYMIEVGGEVRCQGHKGTADDPKPWLLGIEKPLIVPPGTLPGLQRTLAQMLPRSSHHSGMMSLATSGDYRNFREIGGVRVSHIVDPSTCWPTEKILPGQSEPKERLGSVSVLGQSCARADALATALFVMGEEKGLKLAEQQGLAVLYLFRTGQNEIREAASEKFPK